MWQPLPINDPRYCQPCRQWIAPTISRQQHEMTKTHRKAAEKETPR